MAPTVTQAICRNGVLEPPTLTTSTTDGITYTTDADPPYAPAQTVVVTATLDDAGVGWPDPLPADWTETDATTATYEVTFADVACTPVTPVAPTVTEATCAAGVVTAPTIGLATTPGLVYVADPAGPYDPTVDTDVVVTATVLDGFAWEDAAGPSGFARQSAAPSQVELPEGWTWVSPTEATFAVALAAIPPCPGAVAPTSSVATGAAGVDNDDARRGGSNHHDAAWRRRPRPQRRRARTDADAGGTTITPQRRRRSPRIRRSSPRPRRRRRCAAAPSTTIAPPTRRWPPRRPRRRSPKRSRRPERPGSRCSSSSPCSPLAGGVLLVIGARRRIH